MLHFTKNPRKFVLIVDESGIIGKSLTEKLSEKTDVVYLGPVKPNVSFSSVKFITYKGGVPVIPENDYSKTFIVFEKNMKVNFLLEFVKRAIKYKSEIIIISSIAEVNLYYKELKRKTEKLLKEKNKDTLLKIVLYDQVISKDKFPLEVEEAIRNQKIEVGGSGLRKIRLVFFEDLISGIINAGEYVRKNILNSPSEISIFYLFPKYSLTEISFARIIKKANPSIEINFVENDKKRKDIKIPDEGLYILSDDYPLEQKIKQLDLEKLSAEYQKTIDTLSLKKPKKKKKPFFFKFSILFVLIFLFLPFFISLITSIFGSLMLINAKNQIENGSLTDAKKSAVISNYAFTFSEKFFLVLQMEAGLIGQSRMLNPLAQKIYLGRDLSSIIENILIGSEYIADITNGRSSDPQGDFDNALSYIKDAASTFREAEASGEIPQNIIPNIDTVKEGVSIFENTASYLPDILGFNEEKIYLILFQNNMELRPGGGFIGSYGLLTFESGSIKEFSIHDVYDADGQLREHVEPPFPIRRYLALPHWYLRDSNFNVDFTKSAESAALLLGKELGIEVDGVIGIDVTFVKNLLEAIGPVYVPEYRETVDTQNLYMVTESYSEKNFFPGSRQKKEFLSSLFDSIMFSLESKEKIPYVSIFESVTDSISSKHIMFAFNDRAIQDLFVINNWSSTVWDARENSPQIINDFLGINEANLGANKSNFFIERKLDHRVEIMEDGTLTETLNIYYKNSSDGWPGGEYVNYLRIILPFNTSILSVSIDEEDQTLIPAITDYNIYESRNFFNQAGLEIERYDQDGKTIYGFLVRIGAGQEKEIDVRYRLADKIPESHPNFSYSLRYFKQPGTELYPYKFTIEYPEDLKIIKGKKSFSDIISSDINFNINFIKE